VHLEPGLNINVRSSENMQNLHSLYYFDISMIQKLLWLSRVNILSFRF
jgi:hypothetical protein